jgi:hypothetical protein
MLIVKRALEVMPISAIPAKLEHSFSPISAFLIAQNPIITMSNKTYVANAIRSVHYALDHLTRIAPNVLLETIFM